MKSELWSKVKAGDYLIYADEYAGVFKAKVTEVDITIETFEPEYKKEQPYGLTAETGIVRIRYDETELTENLANLIRFNLTWYTTLKKMWNVYQKHKETMETWLDTFVSKRAELREK